MEYDGSETKAHYHILSRTSSIKCMPLHRVSAIPTFTFFNKVLVHLIAPIRVSIWCIRYCIQWA